MINKRIKIRGAIGIKKGLGLDEIEFDFTGKTGLVALSGPNGRGKTTLLELMSLFRTLASRKGSLKNHFFLRDSFVEQDFIYNGDDYRIIWKIDAGSDRQEAFIIVNGDSIVNGKVTEYDRYIIENFGTQNLFYNSVFCAQGSGNMSDMTTGKIKELFVEFLRIERLADYETTCKGYIKELVREKDILDSDINRLTESISSMADTEAEIEEKKETISAKKTILKRISERLFTATTELDSLNDKKSKAAGVNDQITGLEKQLVTMIAGRDKITEDVKALDADHNGKVDSLRTDIKSLESILSMAESITSAKDLLDSETIMERYFSDCMTCAIDEQTSVDKEMKHIRETKIEPISEEMAKISGDKTLSDLLSEKEKIDGGLVFLESKKSVLSKSIEAAGEDIALVGIDYQIESAKTMIAMAIDPDCKSTICPALISIEESKKGLPEMEKSREIILADIETKKDELNAELAIIEARLQTGTEKKEENLISIELEEKRIKEILDDLKISLELAKSELSDASALWMQVNEIMSFYRDAAKSTRKEISNLSDLAQKAGDLEAAVSRKAELEKNIAEAKANFSTRREALSSGFDEAVKNIESVESDIDGLKIKIDSKVDDKIFNTQTDIDSLESSKVSIVGSINDLEKDLAVKSESLERLKGYQKTLSIKNDKLTEVKKEITEWSYLRDACGKNGLQALEIDGAAPLITTEANSLLEKAFGLDSQIKIVTQDPETGKEVFWIKVIREDGAEDNFGNLSGGQKVWIAKALSLGMTLVSKRKSGRNFMTLFADEEDGALDGEKALEFIKLYRAMMATGDFETCFFISHNPNVVAMADHVIDFGAL